MYIKMMKHIINNEILAQVKRVVTAIALLLLFIAAPKSAAAQDGPTSMRVQGRVIDADSKPIPGVFITQNYVGVARTDEDGYFNALVSLSIPMKFYGQGYSEAEHMPNLAQQQIQIVMGGVEMAIDAVQITIKDSGEAMRFEDSQMEIVGDYIHLRTRFYVPQKVFSKDTRLIVQPILQDHTTTDSMFFKAMVVDGRTYDMVDKRKYGFESDRNPVAIFKSDVKITRDNKMVSYHDSMKLVNVNGEFSARVALSIEDYNRLLYLDFINIADGTINPLRFFYKYVAGIHFGFRSQEIDEMVGPSPTLLGLPITDPRYTPAPNLKLYNDHGSARIAFRVNAATIDYNDQQSLADLGAISGRLKQLLNDPDASVQGVVIRGIASPDGVYVNNRDLAARRSEFILSELTPAIPQAMRAHVKMDHSSEVASWLEVATILEEEEYAEYAGHAATIRTIVEEIPTSYDEQFSRIRRIPIYNDIIAQRILPSLRRVEYEIQYSIFRILSAEEIREVYHTDPKALSRHDYHILLTHSQHMDLMYYKQIVDSALDIFPSYAYALNEKTRVNMSERVYDASLLEPYVNKQADPALLFNNLIMSLKVYNYADAYDIMKMLPSDDARMTEVINISKLNSQEIESVRSYYENEGGINEVLVLLALKVNAEAYAKINTLPMPEDPGIDQAVYLYVKAVCANRMENLGDAIASLQAAVEMHPPLADIMNVDADLLDLVELIVVPE